MVTLSKNELTFSFPDVHELASCSIEFQRTLRIPDDGHDHYLPPGLGSFPLRHLDDYGQRLPQSWVRRGGVVMPIHQAEAMWINFSSPGRYPFAVKIATGKICAVSGDNWANHLNRDPQDYVVVPDQPWLDGYCVEKGLIRQFVAMPLGSGYTAEEQLTGKAENGGLQIVAYPMKRERYEELFGEQFAYAAMPDMVLHAAPICEMGMAPGGRMRQEIYDDEYGLDAWDQRHASRCFVTVANSVQWRAIAGEQPPTRPPTARQYADAGLPWFEYFGSDATALAGAEKLEGLKSVGTIGKQLGQTPLPENESIMIKTPVPLGKRQARPVREFVD